MSASLPPVTAGPTIICNPNVHILQLLDIPTEAPPLDPFGPRVQTTARYLRVLTLGHGTLQGPLPSVLTALCTTDRFIALLPPWQSYNEAAAETTYIDQHRSNNGGEGPARRSASYLEPEALDPLFLQDEVAFPDPLPLQVAADARPLGSLSRRLLSFAASIVEPALNGPIGALVPAPEGLPFVQLDQNTATNRPPVYIGAGPDGLPAIQDFADARWTSKSDLARRLIEGPGLIANSVLQLALDHWHQVNRKPAGEREEMHWVVGGGARDRDGQPDFVLEHRRGPDEPWTVLVVCKIKLFIAAPLLVPLLRDLRSAGSAGLTLQTEPTESPVRPAYDGLLTQVAQQMARSGAHCGAIWTGLDWVVVERVRSETGAVALRVWPKLLRSVWMRELGGQEPGVRAKSGTTRCDQPDQPRSDEEEMDLNEAGILICLALHARRLSEAGEHKTAVLTTTSRRAAGTVEPLMRLSANVGQGPLRRTLYRDQVPIGSGTVGTVHRAKVISSIADATCSSYVLPFVAKFARDRVPPGDEFRKWPHAEFGPYSFATVARKSMAIEVAAYLRAAELQESVLPKVEGVIPVEDSSVYLNLQDDGEAPPITSTSSGPSGSTSPPTQPRLFHAIVLTYAGYSLLDLVAAEPASDFGQVHSAPPDTPSLRTLFANVGLRTRGEALAWLQDQALQAVRALHDCGVAHGGISRGNVCIEAVNVPSSSPALRLRLIDLGNAVFREPSERHFQSQVERDLVRAQEVARWAVDEVWSGVEDVEEFPLGWSDSPTLTHTPMAVDDARPSSSA